MCVCVRVGCLRVVCVCVVCVCVCPQWGLDCYKHVKHTWEQVTGGQRYLRSKSQRKTSKISQPFGQAQCSGGRWWAIPGVKAHLTKLHGEFSGPVVVLSIDLTTVHKVRQCQFGLPTVLSRSFRFMGVPHGFRLLD